MSSGERKQERRSDPHRSAQLAVSHHHRGVKTLRLCLVSGCAVRRCSKSLLPRPATVQGRLSLREQALNRQRPDRRVRRILPAVPCHERPEPNLRGVDADLVLAA
jgi:hypothetical protein